MAINPLSSPFPDIGLEFVDAKGRLNRIWYEFLLRQFKRTGSEQGFDISGLERLVKQISDHLNVVDGEIDDLNLLVEANPMGAMFVAVLGRLAALEMLVASQPAGLPAQRAQTRLPDPVAPIVRSMQNLPDPVAAVARPANDDLRKLIEAQT